MSQKHHAPTIHTLTISNLGQRGDGRAALDDGTPVFIDRALEGETISAALSKSKDGVLRGEIIEIIEASPNRTQPPCPHYEQCGGCQTQHMSADLYKSWQRETIEALCQRHLGTTPPFKEDITIPAATRRRITLACVKTKGTLIMGYHKRRSKQVSDIQDCLIADPALMNLASKIRPYIRDIIKEGRIIDLFLQKLDGGYDCVITGDVGIKGTPDEFAVQEACARMLHETDIARISWRKKERALPELILQEKPLYKRAGKLTVSVPPLAFMQPSTQGEAALIKAALDAAPPKTKRAADLFAGHGTFTGALVQAGISTDAFESDSAAITALKKAGHGQAYERDLFKYPLSVKELQKYDLVLLDPPRAGAKAQCEILASSKIENVIYVSCNPTSFAKDATRLCDGGYTLQSVQIIDQFAHSTHCEVIGTFNRSSA